MHPNRRGQWLILPRNALRLGRSDAENPEHVEPFGERRNPHIHFGEVRFLGRPDAAEVLSGRLDVRYPPGHEVAHLLALPLSERLRAVVQDAQVLAAMRSVEYDGTAESIAAA